MTIDEIRASVSEIGLRYGAGVKPDYEDYLWMYFTIKALLQCDEVMSKALENCENEVDHDNVITRTEDGEKEYWISNISIQSIAIRALGKRDKILNNMKG